MSNYVICVLLVRGLGVVVYYSYNLLYPDFYCFTHSPVICCFSSVVDFLRYVIYLGGINLLQAWSWKDIALFIFSSVVAVFCLSIP